MKALLIAGLVSGIFTGSQADYGLYGERGDFGSCRSTVEWNQNRFRDAEKAFYRWAGYYDHDLDGYRDGTVKYTNVNKMWAIQEMIKDKNYSPKTFNKRQWMRHVKKIFMRDCGGFLKKDREIAESTVEVRMSQWEMVELMMTQKQFVKNWKTRKAYFPGYYDYRTPTGYNIP